MLKFNTPRSCLFHCSMTPSGREHASSSQPGLAGVVATDFYFSEVDDALGRLPSTGVSQLVAVVLNTSGQSRNRISGQLLQARVG